MKELRDRFLYVIFWREIWHLDPPSNEGEESNNMNTTRDRTELRILDDNSVRHLALGIATSFQDTKHIPSTLIKGQSREGGGEKGRHESVRVEKRRGFQRVGEEGRGEKRKEKTKKKERRATVNSNHLIADPAAAL